MRTIALFIIFCHIICLSCSKEQDDYFFMVDDSLYCPAKANLDVINVLKKPNLKILFIGNSFTEDYTNHLPMLISSLNVNMYDVSIYRMVRGAGSFRSWYYTSIGRDFADYYLYPIVDNLGLNISTRQCGAYDNSLFLEVLQHEWDVIVLSQASAYSSQFDSWFKNCDAGYIGPWLFQLRYYQPNALYAFVMGHSYMDNYEENAGTSSYECWKKNVDVILRLQEKIRLFQLIIPCGTAVENLRHTEWNNSNDLTRDGKHLEYGLASYSAACCVYQSLLKARTGVDCVDNTYRYICDSVQQSELYHSVDVTERNCYYAQKAAMFSIDAPFNIIEIP